MLRELSYGNYRNMMCGLSFKILTYYATIEFVYLKRQKTEKIRRDMANDCRILGSITQ